jgi:hypothetical protein
MPATSQDFHLQQAWGMAMSRHDRSRELLDWGCPHGTDIMFKRNISTRFDCLVCIRLALQHLDTDKESYIPGLYIPSKWEPLWQMHMLKPVLWNLLKDLNDLHCMCPNDILMMLQPFQSKSPALLGTPYPQVGSSFYCCTNW